jgi:hypothetical protein
MNNKNALRIIKFCFASAIISFIIYVFQDIVSLSHATVNTIDTSIKAVNKSEKILYYNDVEPILKMNCYQCHGPASLTLNLTSYESIIDSKIITKFKPQESNLWKSMISSSSPHTKIISPDDLAIVRAWISQGALKEYVPEIDKDLEYIKAAMASNKEDAKRMRPTDELKRVSPSQRDEYLGNLHAMIKVAEYKGIPEREKINFFADLAQGVLLSIEIEDKVVRHRLYQIMDRAERLKH